MAKDYDPFEVLQDDPEEPELRALLASLQGEKVEDKQGTQPKDQSQALSRRQASSDDSENQLLIELEGLFEGEPQHVKPDLHQDVITVQQNQRLPLVKTPVNVSAEFPLRIQYVLGNQSMSLEHLKGLQPGACFRLNGPEASETAVNVFLMSGRQVLANGHLVLANGGLAIQIDCVVEQD